MWQSLKNSATFFIASAPCSPFNYEYEMFFVGVGVPDDPKIMNKKSVAIKLL